MTESPITELSHQAMVETFLRIEKYLEADVLVYCGGFSEGADREIKHIIEDLKNSDDNKNTALYMILTTTGGSLNPVKRIVDILRHHYSEIYFIVPDYAYSAGTILCASGDKIYMSYFSALGPIDPQIFTKDRKMVSAIGYLDKIEEMLKKANNGTLTQAEFLILKDFDLAELRSYEQARELAEDLLKEWLPKYKFKNWDFHKDGTKVTPDDRIERAAKIAQDLGNNSRWKSHSRPINMEELRDMKLIIDNLQDDEMLYKLITNYHNLMTDYIGKYSIQFFIQTRRFL